MNDADRKALEAWKVSTPEIKYKFENGSLLQEMIADEAWQAALEWRDSQVGEPVAWLMSLDELDEALIEARNHTEGMLDKVDPAVAVNERLLCAAKKYFMSYCQDEASEFGPDDTGCSQEQHKDAVELGEAITAAEQMKGGVE